MIFCFSSLQFLHGQNVIKNGGFENYTKLPSESSQIDRCIGMSGLGIDSGTPDFIYADTHADCSYMNWLGYQKPHSGKGYCAIVAYSSIDAREYLQVELDNMLIKDSLYLLEFFVSLSEYSGFLVEGLGVTFVQEKLFDNSSEEMDKLKWLSLEAIDSDIDTLNWRKEVVQFRAQGDEKYLIMGRSTPVVTEKLKRVEGYKKYGKNDRIMYELAACYIDDISLVTYGWEYRKEIWDINSGFEKNIEIAFEVDSSEISNFTVQELNRMCTLSEFRKLRPILLVNSKCEESDELFKERIDEIESVVDSLCVLDWNINILSGCSYPEFKEASRSLKKYQFVICNFLKHYNGQTIRDGVLYDIGFSLILFVP
jgi:hypothetical protein